MKKWVVGCLIVLVLAGIGGVVGTYLVYRWGKSKVDTYVTSVQQFGDAAKMDEQVSNKALFTAPSNGELTADQVDRFMKVQEGLETKMGARLKELDAKYDALSKSNGGKASITTILARISTPSASSVAFLPLGSNVPSIKASLKERCTPCQKQLCS